MIYSQYQKIGTFKLRSFQIQNFFELQFLKINFKLEHTKILFIININLKRRKNETEIYFPDSYVYYLCITCWFYEYKWK